ncbi:MAG: FCD domain-containing protein [Bifidobacteriaceae bacterium]|nr:FCD domain-containing protein [Bifidobacteriaceae bacterium]
MTHPIPSLRSRTLTEQVKDAIRDYVVLNHLKPGDQLPSESEFGRSFGVSRNAVREAVKALESMGLIEVHRGNGLFVKQFSFAPLLAALPYGLLTYERPLAELLEIRQIIELGFIERVVLNHEPSDLAAADAALAQMQRQAARGESFEEADRAFHQALFTSVGNEMVAELIDVFWLAFATAASRLDLHTKDPMSTYLAHAEIAQAVRDRDVSGAREKLANHYRGIADRLQLANLAGTK